MKIWHCFQSDWNDYFMCVHKNKNMLKGPFLSNHSTGSEIWAKKNSGAWWLSSATRLMVLSEIDKIQGRQKELHPEFKSLSGSSCSCSCRGSNLHSYSSCLPSGLQTGRSDTLVGKMKNKICDFETLWYGCIDANGICIVTVVPEDIWKGQRQTNAKDWGTKTN